MFGVISRTRAAVCIILAFALFSAEEPFAQEIIACSTERDSYRLFETTLSARALIDCLEKTALACQASSICKSPPVVVNTPGFAGPVLGPRPKPGNPQALQREFALLLKALKDAYTIDDTAWQSLMDSTLDARALLPNAVERTEAPITIFRKSDTFGAQPGLDPSGLRFKLQNFGMPDANANQFVSPGR